jgi:hypothetical protein
MVAAAVVKAKWKDRWNQGMGPVSENPALMEKLHRIVLAQAQIRLLINPTEADHQHLYEAIDAALRRLKSAETLDTETETDIETITSLAQAIPKRERRQAGDVAEPVAGNQHAQLMAAHASHASRRADLTPTAFCARKRWTHSGAAISSCMPGTSASRKF